MANRLANIVSRPGFVAGFVGVALLVELAAAWLLLSADRERVVFAGVPIHNACAFKQRFGIPCPACGMTRSLVLTLHGDVATATELNPGGPVAIFALLYFSGAMIFLVFRQARRSERDLAATVRRIRWSTALLGLALIVVVGLHWAGELASSRRNGIVRYGRR